MLISKIVRTVMVGALLQLTAPLALGQCISNSPNVVHFRPQTVSENVQPTVTTNTVISTIAVKATTQLVATNSHSSNTTGSQALGAPKTESSKPSVVVAPTSGDEEKIDKSSEVVEVPLIETNEELEVDVRFAGDNLGQVFLKAGRFEAELDVVSWSPEMVRFETPDLNILKELPVTISVHRPDGYLVRSFEALLIRKQTIRRIAKTIATTNDASQSDQGL